MFLVCIRVGAGETVVDAVNYPKVKSIFVDVGATHSRQATVGVS